jgi:hypothetical protein
MVTEDRLVVDMEPQRAVLLLTVQALLLVDLPIPMALHPALTLNCGHGSQA